MHHFGNTRSLRANYKLRYLVGALSSIVVVLLGVLTFVLSSTSKRNESPLADSSNAWAAPISQIQILVAKGRIEQGMLIDGSLLTNQSFYRENIPEGAILEDNRSEVVGKYATQLIPAGATIQPELLTSEMPLSSETIPAGMRAVTISLDARAGVAGHVRPFSRVDVLCTYERQGAKEIGVVVPYAKVFSVNGSTSPTSHSSGGLQEMSSVTLVVKEEDALRIELARATGSLSLNLVGNTTVVSNQRPTMPISQKNLFNIQEPEPQIEKVKIYGRMTMKSTRDGKLVSFVLTDKGWQDEREIS